MVRLILISFFAILFAGFAIDIYVQSIKRMSLSEKMRKSANKLYAASDGDPVLYFHPDEKNYRIAAQPDEIFETKEDRLVPFLFKTGLSKYEAAPEFLKIQFAAYFKAIEEEYGRNPEYGILEDLDSGKFFKIDNSPELIENLLFVSDEINSKKNFGEQVTRNHSEVEKCTQCEHRNHCKDSLA